MVGSRSFGRLGRRGGVHRRLGVVTGAAVALMAGLLVAVAPPAAGSAPPCAAEAADVAEAAAMAAACGSEVEALSERTERAQVFVRGDGTAKLVSAAVPQRVRGADGSWRAISTDLVRGPDGGWVPEATTADVSFSNGGSGPFLTWREGGHALTLSWPDGPLPEPVIEGSTAIYENIYPGVNLHVTATVDGFRHALEVTTRAAAANPALRQIRYRLGGDLRVESVGDGELAVVSADGETLAVSQGASMWDSSVDAAAAGQVLAGVSLGRARGAGRVPEELLSTARRPGVAATTRPVGVALSGAEVVVTPDVSLLTDPRAALPIFIDPPFNKQRSAWAYANTINSNWDVGGHAWVGRNPYDGTLYRSFFQFDISALAGTTIFSAHVQASLYHSWSCGPTPVYLYRTSSITVSSGGRMPWSTRPLPSGNYLGSWSGNANKAGGCGANQPDATAVWDASAVKSDLQSRASASASTYTVGLCACNSSGSGESTQDRWKKFYSGPTYLVAEYNKPPATPTVQAFSSSTECFVACSSPARVRTTRPTLKVTVSHTYNNQLRTVFEVRTAASDSATLVTGNASSPTVTASGATASWQVPSGVLTNGSTYYWRARSRNANDQYGSWTGWQTLTIDTSAPTASISSSQYPLRQWGQVVGTQGTFVLSGDASVHDFTWQVDSGPVNTVSATGTTTRTASVNYTPATDMVHTMRVTARDTAGNVGSAVEHQFWVAPAPDRCWHWKLDEAAGATTAADSGNTSSGGPLCGPIGSSVTPMPGTRSGSVNFGPGYTGNGAVFTGSGGQIVTSGPVLDTSKSFTVMAWVNPSDLSAGDQTVLSQDGTSVSRFRLGYVAGANGGAGGWCMTMRGSDSTSASTAQVCAPGAAEETVPQDGTWVHVAGVYDATLGQMRVHVLGGEEFCWPGETATAASVGSWQASGAFVIGRARSGGAVAESWRGGVDAVRAYQRALTEFDLCTLVLS